MPLTAGTLDYMIPLPNQPSLIGLNLPLQAGSVSTIAPSLTGAFTNVVIVPFLP